jgi:uncharacterized protein (DUF3084 family)
MTDELNGVLKEIATLLHRQVELHESSTVRLKASQEENEKRRLEFAADSAKRQQELQVTRGREQGDKQKDEDRAFRERLISALDRQNQALETIVSYLKSS